MDARIVTDAQRGDERAFALIVEAVSGRFLGTAHRILHDAQLAEDATQHALLRMWRHLPGLRDTSRFEAWAYRLLVKSCYTEAERHRRWRSDASLGLIDPSAASDPMSGIVARDEIEHALRRLSVEQRAVLVLRYYVDLPIEAVAVALDIAPGTVKSRLHRAHEALRGALEAEARIVAVLGPSGAAR